MSATGAPSDVDLFGLSADDLQEGITVTENAITGTLKYVTGYTGFSGDVELQSGNYIALKFSDAAETVQLSGDPVALDDDKMVVLRIADKDSQIIRVVASDGVEYEFDLSGLTCEVAP